MSAAGVLDVKQWGDLLPGVLGMVCPQGLPEGV